MRKLSRDIVSLEDRMIALEKSMIEVRTNLRDSSTNRARSAQNLFDDSRHRFQGATEDVRVISETMEDLRSENERLRQRLRRVEEPHATTELKDPSVDAAAGIIATSASVAATGGAKKKRPYARRKPFAAAKAVTPAVADADSSLTPNYDQDGPSQLGSLAALNEITAAMTRANSADGNQITDRSAAEIPDAAHDISHANTAVIINGENLSTGQQENLRRTSDEMIGGGEGDEPYAQKKKSRPYDSVETDEMMIDPALRSASTAANPEVPVSLPQVLSSIENPPDPGKTVCTAREDQE